MKKLLTILAATTATLFVFGSSPEPEPASQVETVLHGADFEAAGFVAGEAFLTGVNDGAGEATPYYWYTEDTDASNVISNYLSSGTDVPIASRPDLFVTNNNTKFLQIETTGKLYRSVVPNNGSSNFLTNTVPSLEQYGFAITNTPIYLDTLVKFTAADSAFGDDALSEGDKIAISYVEHESEGGEDPAYTNFVVRAGFVGSELSTNYFVTVPEGFDKEQWHRLTVRTIPAVGNTPNSGVGFVVYLDETNLTYSTSVSAGFANLNATAEGFYNAQTHALFPSAVAVGDIGGQTISAASFSGNGSLDDVVFTTDTPNFIKANESVVVTINLGTGILGATVKYVNAEESIEPASSNAIKLVFNLAPGTTTFNLGVTADTDNGYSFNAAGFVSEGALYGNDTVTITAGNPTITLTAARNNVTYIDEYGNPQSCVKLSEAFENAKDGTTITLAWGVDSIATEGSDFTGYATGSGEYVLDLNGNTIDGGDDSAGNALITVNGTLTIIDSAGGGKIVYDTANGFGIISDANASDVYIGQANSDRGATFEGALLGEEGPAATHIIRGSFDKQNNTDSNTFKYAIAGGSALGESTDDYWVVEPTGGSEPTQVAVPTAVQNLVYDGTEQTGVVAQVGYTLTGTYAATDAGDYTATATLTSGYIWADGTSDPTNITWSIAAKTDAEVTVTLTSEIVEYSAQLEFPTASATIGGAAVEGTPAWDPVSISEPAAGATNTYTVTFTVTTANYAGSTGTATFKVYKSAGGGSNWPAGWNGGTEPASMVTAFNNWIAVSGNDPTAANAEAAFLVGVNLADYTNDLAVASITLAGGKVVITGNYNLSSVNGALAVKMGNAPNALGEPTAVTATEGAISLTPALGETKKFYQLVIGYPAN